MRVEIPGHVQTVVDELRRFIAREVDPLTEAIDRTGVLPDELIEKTKEMGYFGLTIPEEYGGIGLDTVGKCAVEEEAGRTSYAFATLIGNHTGISTMGIVAFGSAEQKERYLPRMASGELIGAFALTEPEAGSDAGSLRTTAVRDGDGWVLTGEKIYITNAPYAGLFTVMARTAPDRGVRGISAFLVERDTPGLSVGPDEEKMGMHGARTAPVRFDGCRLPAGALLGEEGTGFISALRILTKGRVTLAARCVGMCRKLIELSLEQVRRRRQFGRFIGEFQGIRWMLSDMATETEAARLLVYHAAELLDRGERSIREAAMCKLFASETLGRVADRAVQIFGGMGYMKGCPVERIYRDARIARIYEGTSEIQRNIIAAQLLDA
jgi:acyl-CoA dehydrogenase